MPKQMYIKMLDLFSPPFYLFFFFFSSPTGGSEAYERKMNMLEKELQSDWQGISILSRQKC